MQITVKSQAPAQAPVDLLAIAIFKLATKRPSLPKRIAALDKKLGGGIARVIAHGDFHGNADESLLIYPDEGARPKRILLIGLGAEEKLTLDGLRRAAGRCVERGRAKNAPKLALVVPKTRFDQPETAQALAEGAVLAGYHFDEFIEKPRSETRRPPKSLGLLVEKVTSGAAIRRAVQHGITVSESQNLARDLSNAPANVMTPVALARRATQVAKEVGLRCKVMDVPELRRRKMGGILAVGQGSVNPPRLIILEHNPKPATGASKSRSKPICLIGKGITFDSGGLSLKPSPNMHEMKHDMGGAAAVLGAMRAIAALGLRKRVIGIVAAAENMPSASAYRPGDIIRTHSGKTVEVLNTDAEGRIVLADALAYAVETYDPSAMIDFATLTGACMIALGSHASGLLGSDEDLIAALQQAGERSGELVWRLPLFEAHKKAMRGQVSDLVNVSGREAGASTAAGFLSAFVGSTPWAHLDIAGTGWTSKSGPYQPRGATGVGVRLALDYLAHRPGPRKRAGGV